MSEINLPDGWVETTLGEIIELKYGKSLPSDKRDGEGFPVYGSNGVVGSHTEPLIAQAGIIVGRKGSYGEVHFSKIPFFPIDTTYFVDTFWMQPMRYWFYQLKHLPLTSLNRSTAIPGLNREDAYEQGIYLPPLAEQQQIAQKLDELLAQVDTLKTRLDAILKILKRFRQSVLAAAVSGRLTEEWRHNCSADFDSWEKTDLGSVSNVATGKTPKRDQNEYWDSGTIAWLTSSATGKAFTYEAEQFVTEFAVKDCGLKLFQTGTLLLAMYGEGKTRGQVTELKISATCNQACAAITVNESKILRKFIKLVLQESYEETRKVAVGGAQPNLNLNKVREIPVFVPPLEEQTEIVRRVEQLFTYADQIEQRVKDAQARVNHLTQSILAKAFRGELTADWRAQNPESISGENSAAALLERIKVEREVAGKPKRAGKKS